MIIVLIIILLLIILKFKPRFEYINNKHLILWYTNLNGKMKCLVLF